jgi:hypothetical protein
LIAGGGKLRPYDRRQNPLGSPPYFTVTLFTKFFDDLVGEAFEVVAGAVGDDLNASSAVLSGTARRRAC